MSYRRSSPWSRVKYKRTCYIDRISRQRTLSTIPQRAVDPPKPYFITTPIFYPNSVPHIGHLYSTVIADILARYALLKAPSRPVVFVTGTDEHGSKIQKAAHAQGLEGRELEFCDGISERFRQLATKANLGYTRFIRTTEPVHAVSAQHLWRELRGYIYKGVHSGFYSISDECFYTPSQVESVKNSKTGEVCMVSKETGSTVEWTEEENYKFRLSAFRERLLERYHTDEDAILPRGQLELVRGVLANPENVTDISVSRPSQRLKWGIPVPDDPHHVIYVWLEALTAYLTAVGYPFGDTGHARGWPPDIQVIGKDILRFHAMYFPAFLMALDLPLPKTVLSHAHWTMNQMKMSKSIGNVADPFAALDRYETDVVRYYLARVGGRFQYDNDWSETQLVKHQQELFSIMGNQLARAFTPKVVDRLPLAERYISIKPEVFTAELDEPRNTTVSPHSSPQHVDITVVGLHVTLRDLASRYQFLMDRLEIAEALEEVVKCLRLSNREYTNLAPWSPKTPITTVSRLLSYTRETLRICGILLQPIIPSKAGALLDALGVPVGQRALGNATLGRGELPGSAKLPVQAVKLFQRHTCTKQNMVNETGHKVV